MVKASEKSGFLTYGLPIFACQKTGLVQILDICCIFGKH